MARDEFSKEVLDTLAKRVGVRCSNPACRRLTTGPRTDAARIVCTGVGAHITAAASGGPRYDGNLTPKQRRSAENGIWLCQNHAKLVDNDEQRYTVAVLRAWKEQAEEAALAEIEGADPKRETPEDAAEIVLAVGGVVIGELTPQGMTKLPRASGRKYDAAGTCIRHDYELTVTVRNLGNERLSGYHIDLEFPTRVLERPEANGAYVPNRCTRTIAFFRASGAAAPELFPGDAKAVITLPFYVDDPIHYNGEFARGEDNIFAMPVRATLYRSGLPPLKLEHRFEALQNY